MLSKIPPQVRVGLFAALAAAVGLALGLILLKPRAISIESGTLLTPPRALPAFTLTGEDGAPFTNADLTGHWTIVFGGFTTCPDICPTTLTLLKAVRDDLGEAGKDVRVLLLSIDPERDTPEKLKAYVRYFDPSFRGATGSASEIEKLARAMVIAYVKVPGETPETYTMDHSTALMLINPQGQLAGYLTTPHRRPALVTDLKTILDRS